MRKEAGNIFVMIFIAIILIALLTVAIRGYSGGGDTISREDLKIHVSGVMRYGTELEDAVRTVLDNGVSENDIRFAHPDAAAEYGTIATTPTAQIFSQSGGRAEYRLTSTSILASGTGAWEFYGTTNISQVGSAKAELVAVLPNVTSAFCTAVNKELGLVGSGLSGYPEDAPTGTTPECVQGGATYRFGAGAGFNATPNTMDGSTFGKLPMTQGCVACVGAGTDYHYYHVLLVR